MRPASLEHVCPDIARDLAETGGGIVKVNAAPGFGLHLAPSAGSTRDVAGLVLGLLFPDGSDGRIPTYALTGTDGTSTTGRLLAHILKAAGAKVGLASATGILIDGQEVESGDCSGPGSARLVLAEPGVDAAVLECARGGILRQGLGFDRCDVGCVLNVRPDHLGQDGILALEDMAAVAAAVRPGGWSVLNATDPLVAAMAQDAGGRVCWFALVGDGERPEPLREALAQGGRAVCYEEEEIVLYHRGSRQALMHVEEVPLTHGGAALVNVENALAATAMAWCGGVPTLTIRQALLTFRPSFEQLPGRLNLHCNDVFDALLDYAHCAGSLDALGQFVRRLRPSPRRIIALVGAPGDRRDEDVRAMGAVAARHFDLLVLKEDEAPRGRSRGEAAQLLLEGAMAAGLSGDRIAVVLEAEREAVRAALRLAGPGDLVVIAEADIAAAWDEITAFAPEAQAHPRHLARTG